jgi:hypothetical protein
MGTFTPSIEIGDPEGRRWQWVDVLVDSGATFTMPNVSAAQNI